MSEAKAPLEEGWRLPDHERIARGIPYDPSAAAERARITEAGRQARIMWLPVMPPDFALPDGWRDFIRGWCDEDNRQRRPKLPSPE